MKDFQSGKLSVSKRTEIPGYYALESLALNLIWSWNHKADRLWRHLDPVLWDLTCNPWLVLQTVSIEKLEQVLSDPNFLQIIDELVQFNEVEIPSPGWFQTNYPKSDLNLVAYFSMEFMLSEALPIYSGGLGNVAGDQLKSASDLGVPVVGVGLLYQQGYFRQLIDHQGWQQAFYPYNDPGQLPIKPLRKSDGEWLRLEIIYPGWSLWLRAWEVKVGTVTLYLLDSNDPANLPAYRGITSELYGGGSEQRLQQEIILGIGGWRLLDSLGLQPEVCHLNEGHAAFAILERARCFMQKHEVSFEVALAATRIGNVFTTHTAVPAGFDKFTVALMKQYLSRYSNTKLNISIDELLALGRENPSDPLEDFNMAYLAVRGSGTINGVSRLHGKVSQKIFEHLFPRWPESEVPVGYVTNGVHMPSWDSAAADRVWTEVCGVSRWLGDTRHLHKKMSEAPLELIWQMRQEGRSTLIEFARQRLARLIASHGGSTEEVDLAKKIFNPDHLISGFARRFATYKRPNILLHDPERLIRILNNSERPVQLILAGKAHPADRPGQELIHEWINFIKRPECKSRVVFLSDYDMLLTEKMVQGVDVWINTPRRPWEACGTSGMKVLVNGGLNCSELDGWWEEAYCADFGWALGDKQEHGQDLAWDAVEANALYDLLEQQIIPEFYQRNAENLPEQWIKRIRESMACLTPHYSANRAVREYTEKYYLPAAQLFHKRTVNQNELTHQLLEWKKEVQKNWESLRFGRLNITSSDTEDIFDVELYSDYFDIKYLKVELYANPTQGASETFEMHLKQKEYVKGEPFIFTISLLKGKSYEDYTPRVITQFPGILVPMEMSAILWQK